MEGLTLSYFSLAYAGLLYDMRESYHWGRSASSMAQSLASPYILREDCALCLGASLEALLGKEPTFTGDAGDMGLIPESGRSPGEGRGYPFHYSFLENSMDRRAWRATVRGVSELDTTEQLSMYMLTSFVI